MSVKPIWANCDDCEKDSQHRRTNTRKIIKYIVIWMPNGKVKIRTESKDEVI